MKIKRFGAVSFGVILVAIVLLSASYASAQTKNFLCEGSAELRADFTNRMRNVRIRYGTQDIRLKMAKSEEGSKYVAKGTTFWVNGNDAKLESKVLSGDCKAQEMTNMAATETVNYNCGGADLTAEFYNIGTPKRVRIKFGTQDFTLPLVQAASGAKYQEGTTVFWTQGRGATLKSKVLDSECTEK